MFGRRREVLARHDITAESVHLAKKLRAARASSRSVHHVIVPAADEPCQHCQQTAAYVAAGMGGSALGRGVRIIVANNDTNI